MGRGSDVRQDRAHHPEQSIRKGCRERRLGTKLQNMLASTRSKVKFGTTKQQCLLRRFLEHRDIGAELSAPIAFEAPTQRPSRSEPIKPPTPPPTPTVVDVQPMTLSGADAAAATKDSETASKTPRALRRRRTLLGRLGRHVVAAASSGARRTARTTSRRPRCPRRTAVRGETRRMGTLRRRGRPRLG